MPTWVDPYAPKRPRPQPLVVPEVRFYRLGASQRVMDSVKSWWKTADKHERAAAHRGWAEANDTDVTRWLKELDSVFDASMRAIVAWADKQTDPATTRLVLLHSERRRGDG